MFRQNKINPNKTNTEFEWNRHYECNHLGRAVSDFLMIVIMGSFFL